MICDSCGEVSWEDNGSLCPECQANPDDLIQLSAPSMPIYVAAVHPPRPPASRLPLVDSLIGQRNHLQHRLEIVEGIARSRLHRLEELGRQVAELQRSKRVG